MATVKFLTLVGAWVALLQMLIMALVMHYSTRRTIQQLRQHKDHEAWVDSSRSGWRRWLVPGFLLAGIVFSILATMVSRWLALGLPVLSLTLMRINLSTFWREFLPPRVYLARIRDKLLGWPP